MNSEPIFVEEWPIFTLWFMGRPASGKSTIASRVEDRLVDLGYPVENLDDGYQEKFGVSRTELNEQLLDRVNRDSRVHEVGSNIGTQLEALQRMGFANLYGGDVQNYAIERAARERPDLHSLQADALKLPFRDESFDLVFTSGPLIHIPPSKIEDAIREVTCCSSRYIWGSEYFDEEYTEIQYRGQENMLWKADFPSLSRRYAEVKVLETRVLEYTDSDYHDVMYLVERRA